MRDWLTDWLTDSHAMMLEMLSHLKRVFWFCGHRKPWKRTVLYSSYSDMLQILLGRCVWSWGGWWKTMWWFLSWWYLLSSTCFHRWGHRDRTTRHWVIIKKIFQNGRNITSNFRSIQAECTRLNVTCTCKREPSEVCVKFTKFSK